MEIKVVWEANISNAATLRLLNILGTANLLRGSTDVCQAVLDHDERENYGGRLW